MDYTQFLTDLYRNVFGRDPDPGGFAWNLNLLQTGQVDPSTMAADFSNSAEALQYQASGQKTAEQQAQASQQTLQQDVPQNLQQATQPASPDAPADTTPQGKQFGFNFDINNPQNGAVKTDRNNGQWIFTYADGSTATYSDLGEPWAQQIESVTPPFSQYNDQRLGYRNIPYSGAPNVPDTVQIGGVDVQVNKPELVLDTSGKVYVDPNTKNPVSIASVSPQPSDGGFFNAVNTIIAVGAAVIASFAAPEVGAAILTELGADAATITTYANAVGNAVTAAGNTAMQSAINDKNLGQVISAAATAGATAGVGAGAGQAVSSVLPSGLPSSVAGTLAGGGSGALTSLVAGKDPLTGAIKGAIPGLVGGSINDITTGSGDIGEPLYDPVTGRELSPKEVAAMYPELYPGGVLPRPGQVTEYNPDGTVRYVSTGADIAAKTGATLAGGLVNYLMPTTTAPKSSSSSSKSSTTSPSSTSTISGTPTKTASSSYILGSPSAVGSTGPGSQALAQVLNLGSPTSAYSDTGATGETLSPETGGKPRNVWNIESLRVKDETGS